LRIAPAQRGVTPAQKGGTNVAICMNPRASICTMLGVPLINVLDINIAMDARLKTLVETGP
jgi:hypothetical protein